MARVIKNNERHIRWYWDASDSFEMDRERVIYYLVLVGGGKDIRNWSRKIINNVSDVHSGVSFEKRLEGKVKNSDLKYLFSILETRASPEVLGLERMGVKLKKDRELYERDFTKVENYVKRTYEE